MANREYLAKNIRAGITAARAAEIVRDPKLGPNTATRYFVEVNTYDHGRDACGNGTAHYVCRLVTASREFAPVFDIVESGARREQVGYSGRNEAAIYALRKLGYELDLSKAGSYDYHGVADYPLLNFPPVEA